MVLDGLPFTRGECGVTVPACPSPTDDDGHPRPAGRVCADVVEADPLLRLHAVAAARALGYSVDDEVGGGQAGPRPPAARFVGLDCLGLCTRCAAVGATAARHRREPLGRRHCVSPAPAHGAAPGVGDGGIASLTCRGAPTHPPGGGTRVLVIGYCAGPPVLAAVHRLHRCTNLVLELRAVQGAPRFVHAPSASATAALLAGDLSAREADVLLLVLGGFSTEGIAAQLCISLATARSHCRAVLRKCAAADRRSLCARLLGAGAGAYVAPVVSPGVSQGLPPELPPAIVPFRDGCSP